MIAFETGLPVIGEWVVITKATNEKVTEPMSYGKAINELNSRGHDEYTLLRVS